MKLTTETPWSDVHDAWVTRNLAWALWRWQRLVGR